MAPTSNRRASFAKQLLCGFAVALASLGACAQTRYTLGGTAYELVTWPAAAVGTDALSSDAWSSAFGAGHIEVTGEGMHSDPANVGDFYNAAVYADAGYGITGTPTFRVNNGQTEPAGDDIIVRYGISAATLPTELLFYVGGEGGENNGLKYVRWAWSSSQADTRFEALAHTPSFTVSGSGTAALSWRTYGSDNNTAMALVRITNPSGISDFTVASNRLTAAGDDTVYGSTNQRADYNGIAILVPRPAAVRGAHPVPTLGSGALWLLLAAVPLAAAGASRRATRSRRL